MFRLVNQNTLEMNHFPCNHTWFVISDGYSKNNFIIFIKYYCETTKNFLTIFIIKFDELVDYQNIFHVPNILLEKLFFNVKLKKFMWKLFFPLPSRIRVTTKIFLVAWVEFYSFSRFSYKIVCRLILFDFCSCFPSFFNQ